MRQQIKRVNLLPPAGYLRKCTFKTFPRCQRFSPKFYYFILNFIYFYFLPEYHPYPDLHYVPRVLVLLLGSFWEHQACWTCVTNRVRTRCKKNNNKKIFFCCSNTQIQYGDISLILQVQRTEWRSEWNRMNESSKTCGCFEGRNWTWTWRLRRWRGRWAETRCQYRDGFQTSRLLRYRQHPAADVPRTENKQKKRVFRFPRPWNHQKPSG